MSWPSWSTPSKLTKQALNLNDDRYPYSWLSPKDAEGHASELTA